MNINIDILKELIILNCNDSLRYHNDIMTELLAEQKI